MKINNILEYFLFIFLNIIFNFFNFNKYFKLKINLKTVDCIQILKIFS